MDPNNQNIQWLLENGSPAIRLRTWKEIMGKEPTRQMVTDLLEFSMTQRWLARLQPSYQFSALHGSKPECLENVGGKLRELGFNVNMSPKWKNSLIVFINYLNSIGRENAISDFSTLNIYASLSTIGYEHPLLLDMAVDHLKLVGDFCQLMNFDIYIDPDTFGGMYSQYKDRKLLNPETNHRLPTIWDLYMLAYMPRTHHSYEIEKAKHSIINYILTDEYQQFPQGYGIMYHPSSKKYFAHGWKIDLPGWFDLSKAIDKLPTHFFLRVELLSMFNTSLTRKWFQNSVALLNSFKTGVGRYRLPSACLKEGTSGYYVLGNYLRLEENRRRRIALELDSTFRLELLKKRISQA